MKCDHCPISDPETCDNERIRARGRNPPNGWCEAPGNEFGGLWRTVAKSLGQEAAALATAEAYPGPFTDLLVSAYAPEALRSNGLLMSSMPDTAKLKVIAKCPDRGSVLPHPRQPECGCAELTECRQGKGKEPGAVTLSDCLACVS